MKTRLLFVCMVIVFLVSLGNSLPASAGGTLNVSGNDNGNWSSSLATISAPGMTGPWRLLGLPMLVVSVAFSPNYSVDHTIYAGTVNGTFRSLDQGNTWTLVSSLPVGSLTFSPNYVNDHTLFSEDAQNVYRSTDSGATWLPVLSNMGGRARIAISPNYTSDHTIFATASYPPRVFYSTNGGDTWSSPITLDDGKNVNALSVSPNYSNDHTVFLNSQYHVFRSQDGGATWSAIAAGPDLWAVNVSTTFAQDHTVMYTNWQGDLFKSTDGGNTWQTLPNRPGNAGRIVFSPHFATDQTVYFGTWCNGIFFSTDGGANWSNITDENITIGCTQDLVLAPTYDTQRFLLYSTYNGLFIYGSNTFPPDSSLPFVVTNLNDSGPGSLRQAILNAEANPGSETITFDVSGIINLLTPLFIQSPGTTIDGVGRDVTLNGSGITDTSRYVSTVFLVDTGSSSIPISTTIRNLKISNTNGNGFFVGNNGSDINRHVPIDSLVLDGIQVVGTTGKNGLIIISPRVSNVSVLNSTLDAAWSAIMICHNMSPGSCVYPIEVSNLTVRNSTLSGNTALGVIAGATSNFNGITISDSTITGRSAYGVRVSEEFTSTAQLTVQGVSLTNNTISGPGGVFIGGQSTASAVVRNISLVNNTITGTGTVSNTMGIGVWIQGKTLETVSVNQNPAIQGRRFGVSIQSNSTTGASVNNNKSLVGQTNSAVSINSQAANSQINVNNNQVVIGRGVAGAIVLRGNSNDGISISGNPSITGDGEGIYLNAISSPGNTNIVVQGNGPMIGLSGGGIMLSAPNNTGVQIINNGPLTAVGTFSGLFITGTVNSNISVSNNSMTGGAEGIRVIESNPGTGNSIAGNSIYQSGRGVFLKGSNWSIEKNVIHDNVNGGVGIMTGTGNRISQNSIYSNGGLGIDLGVDGVTLNDSGDSDLGPNNLQNYPTLTSVVSGLGNTTIKGVLNSTPNTQFTLEFFSSPAAPAGLNQGKVFLGSFAVTTNASGDAPFSATFSGLLNSGDIVSATATDSNKNTSEFSLDTIAPTATLTQVPAANGAGWNNSDVTVQWTWTDNTGGSGIAPSNCTTQSVLSIEGASLLVTASCSDLAGNVGSASYTVKIDKTAPTIVASATTSPTGAGWYSGNVTIHFTCTDALSGVPAGSCPADQVLSTEGAAVASSAQTVRDVAGNTSASSNVITVKIDKTAPTISISSPQANMVYTHTQTLNIAWTASDALSGIATQSATLDGNAVTNGQVIDLFSSSLGLHTVTVSATDKAGNARSATATFTIKADVNSLSAAVDRALALGWISKTGTADSLRSKLDAVKEAIARGQVNSAKSQLNAFLNELEAQNGKAINQKAYDLLKTDALYLLSTLP